jgi:hypothetical protein
VQPRLERAHPNEIERALHEVDHTGLLVDDEAGMAWACGSCPRSTRCGRQAIVEQCDVRCIARGYERV